MKKGQFILTMKEHNIRVTELSGNHCEMTAYTESTTLIMTDEKEDYEDTARYLINLQRKEKSQNKFKENVSLIVNSGEFSAIYNEGCNLMRNWITDETIKYASFQNKFNEEELKTLQEFLFDFYSKSFNLDELPNIDKLK